MTTDIFGTIEKVLSTEQDKIGLLSLIQAATGEQSMFYHDASRILDNRYPNYTLLRLALIGTRSKYTEPGIVQLLSQLIRVVDRERKN